MRIYKVLYWNDGDSRRVHGVQIFEDVLFGFICVGMLYAQQIGSFGAVCLSGLFSMEQG